jgi:hypothetical protein
MIFSSIGAIDSPSPVTSVVMPWVIFEAARPSTRTLYSDCPSRSMNPGATTRPDVSIVRLAGAPASLPTAVIYPPRTPTSAANQGAPVPSTTLALMNRMS